MQVLAVDRVADSLENLRNLGVHRNMIMYLCVKWAGTEQQKTEDIKIDFREFFERFLTVRNAPSNRLNKPYIIPFENSDAKLWLNRNLAGSFAPSSIRPDNPINTVISWTGKGSKVRYALKLEHGERVFENLLKDGKKIPALDLAVFLYRDFGFNSDEMSVEDLIGIFKTEFGYVRDGEESADYDDVFSHDTSGVPKNLFTSFSE